MRTTLPAARISARRLVTRDSSSPRSFAPAMSRPRSSAITRLPSRNLGSALPSGRKPASTAITTQSLPWDCPSHARHDLGVISQSTASSAAYTTHTYSIGCMQRKSGHMEGNTPLESLHLMGKPLQYNRKAKRDVQRGATLSMQGQLHYSQRGTPVTMALARPSAMAVLPTPGSPSRMGLFFLFLASTCTTLATSLSLPIT